MKTARWLGAVMLVVVLALAPVAVHAEAPDAGWGGASLVEKLLGWIGDWWSVAAGSEVGTEPLSEGEGAGEGVALTEPPMTVSTDPSTENESYPELDPDG